MTFFLVVDRTLPTVISIFPAICLLLLLVMVMVSLSGMKGVETDILRLDYKYGLFDTREEVDFGPKSLDERDPGCRRRQGAADFQVIS